MVKITCDVCGKAKVHPGKQLNHGTWILGWDIESETASALQRSMRILDHWDDRRVLEFGAVHFCSEACKDKYMAKSRTAA